MKTPLTLPEDFTRQMRSLLGDDEYALFLSALSSEPPVSIRINPTKHPSSIDLLSDPVPWCPDACYLPTRPNFTLDPLFHAGCYYVQEASSMYLSQVVRNYVDTQSSITALDLCAAPGGKSTLLLSELSDQALLVTNEVVRQRAHILCENIIKWGRENVIVTSNQSTDFQAVGTIFDFILCDAPCSGEGMFRKDEGAIAEWSLANVQHCQRRQRDILRGIWPCLRPDGILVYSTCTYNRAENEENVQWICEELGADIIESRRFMPHLTRGEGLFMATLRKHTESCTLPTVRLRDKDTRHMRITAYTPHIFPKHHEPILRLLQHKLNVFHYGIETAVPKGKDKLRASHSLAMYDKIRLADFNHVEVDRITALSYLRQESLTLPKDVLNGYILLTYQGHPLGFVNNLGTRANNLYPSEWRIRQSL